MPFKESKRLHNMGDLKALKSTMQGLIKDKVSLHDVVAEREAGKAKVRAENERKLKVIRAKIQLKPPQSNPHNNFTLHKAFL